MAGLGTEDVDVINNALAVFGGGAVFSIDEETDLAEQCNAVYRPLINYLLGAYEWSFASRTHRLDAVSADAANGYDATEKAFQNGWRYGFFLPGDRAGLPHKYLDHPLRANYPLREFHVEENKVFANVSKLWASVPVWTAIGNWSPAFRLLAERALAAQLCLTITADRNLSNDLNEQAFGTPSQQGLGGLMAKAVAAEAGKTRSATPMQRDPLGDARLM